MGALFIGFSPFVYARDLSVLVPEVHKGKITSSLLYEYLKVREDFETRGSADFRSHVAGTQFTYGIDDQNSVAIKGGVLMDPQVEAQSTKWQSRAGYLYGIDLYSEVFPATRLRPGVQVSAGISAFQVPLDRVISSTGAVTLVDQKMSGIDYHGSVLLTYKWWRVIPYTGIRMFGRSVNWHDNQPVAGQPANIVGHAKGNVSIVVGLPIQITPSVRFQAEGVFVNETMATAGLSFATF